MQFLSSIYCHFAHYNSPAGLCLEGETRLTNGDNETSGLVEVCIDGKFGTVCDSSWSDEDAMVVCADLGLSFTGMLFSLVGYIFAL